MLLIRRKVIGLWLRPPRFAATGIEAGDPGLQIFSYCQSVHGNSLDLAATISPKGV